MLETYLVFTVAGGAIVLAVLLWLRGWRASRAEAINFCNSGLTTRQWYAAARLLDSIVHELGSQETKHDDWREAFLGLAPEIQQSSAGQHIAQFLNESHQESLDLAAQALVPDCEKPWLVISKSL